MSRKSLRIHSLAQEEINEAFEWYFNRSPKAAEAFLNELDNAMKRVIFDP